MTDSEKEKAKELTKEKAYSALDFGIGALLLGITIAIVVVVANGIINLVNKWIPATKKAT